MINLLNINIHTSPSYIPLSIYLSISLEQQGGGILFLSNLDTHDTSYVDNKRDIDISMCI